ncbi:MAG: PQQ-like beta-propeller repeat protein [Rickettsiales bacterium]|jgi:hypothetical protein|nr:PQQ-like beta-propeller repeat protein [Rickettsiales bacterium]
MRLTARILLLSLLGGLLTGCSSGGGGDIFVDSRNNLVIREGSESLKFSLGDSVKGAAEIFVNGSDIFIVSMANSIVKFSRESKALVWEKAIASVPLGNLAFDDSRRKIYFTTLDNRFYILDYDSGKIEFIYSNLEERTVTYRLKPLVYRKRNLLVVTFNGGEVIVFDGNKKNILKVISPGPLRDISVTLEGSLLEVSGETVDLDKIKIQ